MSVSDKQGFELNCGNIYTTEIGENCMANIKEVASSAGLSVSCVSKYLKDPASVRTDSRIRIERAISELHYVPSHVARMLRTQKTNMIKVIMHSMTNPYFSNFFEVLRLQLEAQGYIPIMQIIEDNTAFNHQSLTQADGAILVFPNNEKTIHSLYGMAPKNFPMVLCHCRKLIDDLPTMILDVAKGTYLVTEHMIKSGCKKFGYIGGPLYDTVSEHKYRGFVDALKDYHIEHNEKYTIHGPYNIKHGYDSAKQIVESAHTDAIVCANDMLAMGAILGIASCGLQVPDDIRVSGFDNNPLSELFIPSITTIDSSQTIQKASESIIRLLKKKTVKDSVIEPKLIIRTT